jgi:hypothetical protein
MHMTNRFKSALRKAFPTVKFTVERNGEHVTWTDDGPTIEQVQDALFKANCATERERSWDGRRVLITNGDRERCISFNRYNAAEHEAAKAESARRREEYEATLKRQAEAVSNAAQDLHQRAGRIDEAFSPAPRLSPDQLAPLNAALERIRERAEADVKARFETEEGDRRPSWAPPLIIEGELYDLCRELGYLTPDDKPVCRLWATFADPKRAGKCEHASLHTLAGIECRTFTLFAGPHRGKTSEILFEAQREKDGTWRTGPRLYPPSFFRAHGSKCEGLIRERVLIEERLGQPGWAHLTEETLSAVIAEIAKLEAADLENHAKRKRRHECEHRAVELAASGSWIFSARPEPRCKRRPDCAGSAAFAGRR